MSFHLQLKDISKSFGPVRALSHVSVELRDGEVLALMGENGAGKSTLMKILSGLYPCSEYQGQILWNHQEVQFRSPKDSEALGISIIHQELSVFPDLTVAENFFVGQWPTHRGLIDTESLMKDSQDWIDRVGTGIQSFQTMGQLNTGQQQVVEIAKSLAKRAKVVIFDEPTSSLSQQETANLFRIIQELKSRGCGIVYISHRMEEIFKISDRITVLRDGQSVLTVKTQETTEKQIIESMVGRSMNQLFPPALQSPLSDIVLRVEDFKARNTLKKTQFGPLNFELHRGEILGFGGLLGAGRSEVLSALLGADEFETSGKLKVFNSIKSFCNLREAFANKLGLLTEDRKMMSLLPTQSLQENSSLTRLVLKGLGTYIPSMAETYFNDLELKKLKTKFHHVDQLITDLSGGNQQKVIFSRIMQNSPDILILDEPTRGVDVGAKFEIYQLIREWTAKGLSIILVSSDLPELMALSDRVLVMSNGQQMTILEKENIQQEEIMKFALKGFAKKETFSEGMRNS